ncbi:hypothetical protein CERSUDRAFT_112693 [Gelatoporia subvermispora B]|uniref:Uncharacterized protein n=1 Tax=Ceriporiopsis subvermispora (strain B) TaxID=914234 RepID=M2RJL8_CERS8|nr:hypothetical protein CERSUDRAFT_112693 [Gelatoporia subvermispora B]
MRAAAVAKLARTLLIGARYSHTPAREAAHQHDLASSHEVPRAEMTPGTCTAGLRRNVKPSVDGTSR